MTAYLRSVVRIAGQRCWLDVAEISEALYYPRHFPRTLGGFCRMPRPRNSKGTAQGQSLSTRSDGTRDGCGHGGAAFEAARRTFFAEQINGRQAGD